MPTSQLSPKDWLEYSYKYKSKFKLVARLGIFRLIVDQLPSLELVQDSKGV